MRSAPFGGRVKRRAPAACSVCGVVEERLDQCPRARWGGPLCRACHGAKRLAFECPCLTADEAIVIVDRPAAEVAAREALTKIAALLRPDVPHRAPKSPSGNPQRHHR